MADARRKAGEVLDKAQLADWLIDDKPDFLKELFDKFKSGRKEIDSLKRSCSAKDDALRDAYSANQNIHSSFSQCRYNCVPG